MEDVTSSVPIAVAEEVAFVAAQDEQALDRLNPAKAGTPCGHHRPRPFSAPSSGRARVEACAGCRVDVQSGDIMEVHAIGGFCDLGGAATFALGDAVVSAERRSMLGFQREFQRYARMSYVMLGKSTKGTIGIGIVGENVAFGNFMNRGISSQNIAKVCGIEKFESNGCE